MPFIASYPTGNVRHLWRPHPFNPYYIESACGQIVSGDYVVEKEPLKNCQRCHRYIVGFEKNKKALEDESTSA